MTALAFQHVAIVGKPFAAVARGREAAARSAIERVSRFVAGLGLQVSIEEETASILIASEFPAISVAQMGKQCDVVLAVGGDGTVLGIGRQMAPFGVPLIGINQGRLGFMTDVPLNDFEGPLAALLRGEYEREERGLLEATVLRDGASIYSAHAMNDVVVSRGPTAGMVELRVNVDGAFMYSQRADGLIVATPTGSTAYALSAHGPIMHPRLGGIVLVPIAPHSLSNRPIALPDTCRIEIEVAAGRDASVNFDMQALTSLQLGDVIRVERAAHKAVFLHPLQYSYFANLRSKLHWHES
jgi:NAD+ kinase